MNKLPKTDNSLLLRTDFSNVTAWVSLCEAIQVPSKEGFMATISCVSDPAYEGLTVEQLIGSAPESGTFDFIFIADRLTFTDPEQPILVVDMRHEPGRTFRVIPGEMWSIENNLSLSNMDFHEFANSTDPDGVFRGFP